MSEGTMHTFRQAVSSLSTEELVRTKSGIDDDLADIKAQLGNAKAQAILGKYSDPVWFQKASNAARFKGRQSQLLQEELACRNKADSRAFEKAFVDQARLLLPAPVFSAVLDATHAKIKQFKQENQG